MEIVKYMNKLLTLNAGNAKFPQKGRNFNWNYNLKFLLNRLAPILESWLIWDSIKSPYR